MARFRKVELVTFDLEDGDTYPSVCQAPEEVKARFGFVGGEVLVFSDRGLYLGQLVNQLDQPQ